MIAELSYYNAMYPEKGIPCAVVYWSLRHLHSDDAVDFIVPEHLDLPDDTDEKVLFERLRTVVKERYPGVEFIN